MGQYIMTRRGQFKPSKPSPNQCKDKGHKHYLYVCEILFNPNQVLDEQSFIVDHNVINDAIQTHQTQGSCEETIAYLAKVVQQTLMSRGITPQRIILTIEPCTKKGKPLGVAQLRYRL